MASGGSGKRTKANRASNFVPVEDLDFYCRLADYLLTVAAEKRTLSAFALLESVSVQAVSRRVAKLEQQLAVAHARVELLDRVSGSKCLALTQAGNRFLELASEALRRHNDLVGFWKPEAVDPRPPIRVGSTNTMLVNVIRGGVTHYLACHGHLPPLDFRELEFMEILSRLSDQELDFGVGPKPERAAELYPKVEFRDLGQPVEMVLITPIDHPLAERFERTRRARKTPPALSQNDLAGERLFSLSPGLQPGLGDQESFTRWTAGGVPIRMTNYSSIVSFVSQGLGVGIVPGWYLALDDLRLHGRLFYQSLGPIMRPMALALYERKSERLGREAGHLVESILYYARTVPTQPSGQDSLGRVRFPNQIGPFVHGAYISCEAGGYLVPKWRRCEFTWQQHARRELQANCRDIDARNDYSVHGHLGQHQLQWTAMGLGERVNNSFVAGFNVYLSDSEVIVGTWTGLDDSRCPVSGVFLLSSRPLTLAEMQAAARRAQRRVFHQADVLQDQAPRRRTRGK